MPYPLIRLTLFALALSGCLSADIERNEIENSPGAPAMPKPAAPAAKPAPAPKLSSAKDTAHLVPGAPIPDDPLAAYVAKGPPRILREIPAPPKTKPVPAGLVARHVLFESYTADTPEGPVTNEIHAMIVAPSGGGRRPGVLVLHGGAGNADAEGAYRWARRGYVAVAIDLPNIGKPELQASTGHFKSLPYAARRFAADPDIKAGKLIDAVVAGIDGFRLLQSLPEVQKDRLGIVGISWGGYTTTMLCSLLGDEVRAAYNIYGSGFYEMTTFRGQLDKLKPAERATWVRHLDPGYRAASIRAAFFFAGASKDIFFYPSAIYATHDQIPGDAKRLFLVPNVSHSLNSKADGLALGEVEKLWMDHHLKGEGAPFPSIRLDSGHGAPHDRIQFSVTSKLPLTRVQVFYSLKNNSWEHKRWRSVDAVPAGGGRYTASIPRDPELKEAGDVWYVLVQDERGATVCSPAKNFRFDPQADVPRTLRGI